MILATGAVNSVSHELPFVLIVISAGDHQSNNKRDEYQQTFYIAETALIEGEKYELNQFLGPWSNSNHVRDTSKRNLPANNTQWNGHVEHVQN